VDRRGLEFGGLPPEREPKEPPSFAEQENPHHRARRGVSIGHFGRRSEVAALCPFCGGAGGVGSGRIEAPRRQCAACSSAARRPSPELGRESALARNWRSSFGRGIGGYTST
jgi:hypothetical protein